MSQTIVDEDWSAGFTKQVSEIKYWTKGPLVSYSVVSEINEFEKEKKHTGFY